MIYGNQHVAVISREKFIPLQSRVIQKNLKESFKKIIAFTQHPIRKTFNVQSN